jgi:hypothetical protein
MNQRILLKTIIFLAAIIVWFKVDAQDLNVKYILTDFEINSGKGFKMIYSEAELNEMGSLVVFYEKNNEVHFSNSRSLKDSESYGPVLNLKKKCNANKEILTFKWAYKNTYDHRKGIARVKILKTYISAKKAILTVFINVPKNRLYREKPYKILLKGKAGFILREKEKVA